MFHRTQPWTEKPVNWRGEMPSLGPLPTPVHERSAIRIMALEWLTHVMRYRLSDPRILGELDAMREQLTRAGVL